MTRIALLLAAVAALAPAAAATPTLRFTAIEFKNTGFMDYTDDACMAVAREGQEGEE